MKNIFGVILVLSSLIITSQESKQLNLYKQLYVEGDVAVIGNSIIGKTKRKEFNDMSVINDMIHAKYIDIDNDKDTFSSSSATLSLPEVTGLNIVSATLYWSAIYNYDFGKSKKANGRVKYVGNGRNGTPFNKVKFKTPNSDYLYITGDIIYDSYKDENFKDNKPYVCYADVTDIIKSSKDKSGDYYVANIKATQGYVVGGSSGGWLLYIIYEQPRKKPKYVSLYHGLVTIEEKKPVVINFSNFETVKEGDIEALLTIGALEGDSDIKRDQCEIFESSTGKYKILSNELRPEKNFFKGVITRFDDTFTARTPNSLNNFGFDLVKMKVPNKDNRIISNGMTETSLKFSSKRDRSFLFFTAFKTEIGRDSYEKGVIEQQSIINNKSIVQQNNNAISTGRIEGVVLKEQVSTNSNDIVETIVEQPISVNNNVIDYNAILEEVIIQENYNEEEVKDLKKY